jgi:hypothetical protein
LIGVLANSNVVDLTVGLNIRVKRLGGLIGIVFGLIIIGWREAVECPISKGPVREPLQPKRVNSPAITTVLVV